MTWSSLQSRRADNAQRRIDDLIQNVRALLADDLRDAELRDAIADHLDDAETA